MNGKWKLGHNCPSEPGWYGILIMYDPREGSIPEAEYWDGEKWEHDCSFIVGYTCEHFESEIVAHEFAINHAPNDRYAP